jgi:hypothetical protein
MQQLGRQVCDWLGSVQRGRDRQQWLRRVQGGVDGLPLISVKGPLLRRVLSGAFSKVRVLCTAVVTVVTACASQSTSTGAEGRYAAQGTCAGVGDSVPCRNEPGAGCCTGMTGTCGYECCIKAGLPCEKDYHCCTGTCTNGICACGITRTACDIAGDCCTGLVCDVIATGAGLCVAPAKGACEQDADCLSLICRNGRCNCGTPQNLAKCLTNTDCCTPFTCDRSQANGTCCSGDRGACNGDGDCCASKGLICAVGICCDPIRFGIGRPCQSSGDCCASPPTQVYCDSNTGTCMGM